MTAAAVAACLLRRTSTRATSATRAATAKMTPTAMRAAVAEPSLVVEVSGRGLLSARLRQGPTLVDAPLRSPLRYLGQREGQGGVTGAGEQVEGLGLQAMPHTHLGCCGAVKVWGK